MDQIRALETAKPPRILVATNTSLKSAADVAERLLGGVAPSHANVEVHLNLAPPAASEKAP